MVEVILRDELLDNIKRKFEEVGIFTSEKRIVIAVAEAIKETTTFICDVDYDCNFS